MDKRTILALVLIGLIFMVWSYFGAPKPEDQQLPAADTTARTLPQTAQTPTTAPPPTADLGPKYAPRLQGDARYITIETPKYKATLNTRGGLLARFELKEYNAWYGAPVQLINDSAGFPGVLGLTYRSRDGRDIVTDHLLFDIEAPEKNTIGENDSLVVIARLPVAGNAPAGDSTGAADSTRTGDTTTEGGGYIEKRFVFRGNSYGIDYDVTMHDMAAEIDRSAYEVTWRGGLKLQEHNSVDESSHSLVYISTPEDLTKFTADETGTTLRETTQGTINWVGLSTKYFGAALIPDAPLQGSAVEATGTQVGADSAGIVRNYDLDLAVRYTQPTQTQGFTVFVGPLEYDVAEQFGVTGMVSFGAQFLIRPIGEFFMLPLFRFLHGFIGNYGVVIIVFSLIIRLLLWPFSIPQIKSSRKMQLLQPKIAELRERFKDDQQRQQMETMNLYREYGINPLGGCLPLVLQLPILYALWGTLNSAIDLRQASFAFWIHDLSIPDVVLSLPFSLPLLGNTLSGLALIMGATLFVQQKMLITDPKQKAMIYFMPVLLTVAFNHLPSGLNLYYLTFNAMAIAQQVYMTKFSKNPLTLETLKAQAATKKKGWLSRKMEEAQKIAEMQGKVPPGGAKGTGTTGGVRKVDGRTPVEPRKKK